VLVVADLDRVAELVGALSEPLPTAVTATIEVLASIGGDETLVVFEARMPHVVVVTASLEAGDPAALIEAMRRLAPRSRVGVVLIGDPEGGAIRNALDASSLAPDRFVSRPMAPRTLRFAVASALEAVLQARSRRTTELPATPVPVDALAVLAPTAERDPREARRRRWEALADSIADREGAEDDPREDVEAASAPPGAGEGGAGAAPVVGAEAPPVPSPIVIRPRRVPGARDDAAAAARTLAERADGTGAEGARRDRPGGRWSEPQPLAELLERDAVRELARDLVGDDPARGGARAAWDRTAADVDAAVSAAPAFDRAITRARHRATAVPSALDEAPTHRVVASDPVGIGELALEGTPTGLEEEPLGDLARGAPVRIEVLELPSDPAPLAPSSTGDGRDFARQLRAKMSQMAQRLFAGADAPPPAPADLAPRHDHATEIDLAAFGAEPALSGADLDAVTSVREVLPSELEPAPSDPSAAGPGAAAAPPAVAAGSPSWDSQARDRALPDRGDIRRGVADAATVLARVFTAGATGRVCFRRDEGETIVYVDQGRPVFASSSEARDRMGELLVREGKITAAQYERCQSVVTESGRRMGEILVDLGYLKRRELLPAVRRHVEDLVYALFGWDRGAYQIIADAQPSSERIRLSRHPAALILEGVRRKLGRSVLERLVGPPSTVIEVADRERLGSVIHVGDLSTEERAALAAFDGHSDLAQVSRVAGVDLADVLPLAWGLCVLGLATARRADPEVPEEGVALVGETDLAIDRERVLARWQLVTEADYFALLGVRRDATAFEIRRAYQAARRDFAAEGFPPALRRELTRELDDIANVLDEAFRVLRDDRLRQTYLVNLVE
jgi:DNA-binding NarL/FixJ family response regulator